MQRDYGSFKLGINTGFAVNRYSEPEVWTKIIGKKLGLKIVQLTADMINPSLPDKIIDEQIERISQGCELHDINITSTFTGAFTRVNHLAHPDKKIREYWVNWFKTFVDLSIALGAKSMGSHFGIFTEKDNLDISLRAERRKQNIEGWHEIGKYAKKKGLSFLSWEPMSISREQGEKINAARVLHNDVNKNSPIPFKMCLDVDHGDITSEDSDDTNPYIWLKHFAKEASMIHLKQSSQNKNGHWPFTKIYNQEGKIIPRKILNTLINNGKKNSELLLEISFREREPTDSTVIPVLKESVNYWRTLVKN